MSSSSSRPNSPRSTFDRIEKRMSLNNLLKEANLDRNALLAILKENPVNINDLNETKIQMIIKKAS